MSIADRTAGSIESAHVFFRLAAWLFACLLALQCVWLLVAEFSRPGIDRLPTDATAAAAAATQRDAAAWAAVIGLIRGDLWAESAYTYASLVIGDNAAKANPPPSETIARARRRLNRALNDAPVQPSVWLLLAGLDLRYPQSGADAAQALKMSYYTGPSEQGLIPLRLRIAAQADKFGDIEISQLATRDLRLLLGHKQTGAIVEAYNAASPDGKQFIARAVGEIDPSALGALRAGSPSQQSLPN